MSYICKGHEADREYGVDNVLIAIGRFYEDYGELPYSVSSKTSDQEARLEKLEKENSKLTLERDQALERLQDVFHAAKKALSSSMPATFTPHPRRESE